MSNRLTYSYEPNNISNRILTPYSPENFISSFQKKPEEHKNIITNKKNESEIDKIRQLFFHYSNNEPYLSNKQYTKFLSDAQLFDNKNLDKKYANILFYSYTKAKNNLIFKNFCDLLVKLAELKFPDEFMKNQGKTIDLFLNNYLFSLLQILNSPSKLNKNKNINYQLMISKLNSILNKEIIENNYLLFAKIYLKYFCFEKLKIANKQKNHLSNRAFLKVMNDFEISPFYINFKILNEIFDNIILYKDFIIEIFDKLINVEMCPNEGMYFTLYHFIMSIYLIAINNIIISNKNNNVWEMFINGNDSEAFEKITKIFLKADEMKNIMENKENNLNMNNNNNNFDENNIQNNNNNNEIITNEENNNNNNSNNYTLKGKTTGNFNYNNNNNNNNNNITEENYSETETKLNNIEGNTNLPIKEMGPCIVRRYYDTLINIYKFYSELFYETIFSIYMTQNGFSKFIRDIGLCNLNSNNNNNLFSNDNLTEKYLNEKLKANLLSFPTINFIFSKFSSSKNKNSNKRINFENFVNIILCLSNKIYNPLFNSIHYENKSFPIENLINNEFPIKYAYGFIENYIVPLYNDLCSFIEENSFKLENLMFLFETEPLKNVVDKIFPVLKKILKFYCDNRDFIEYKEYFQFLFDFEIFPDLISRTKMIKIYINFIDNFDREYLLKGNNKISLEIDRCVYAIFFISLGEDENNKNFIVNNNNKEILIRLIYFLQRMIQTKGLDKMSIKNGNNSVQREFIKVFNNLKDKYVRFNGNNQIEDERTFEEKI